jgi:putative hydrolase of the HAD superfamily
MIKNILFDLDGTIRHNIPSGGDVFADYAATLGLKISAGERTRAARWEHYYWANSLELKADFDRHNGQNTDFWLTYARRYLIALGASAEAAERLAPLVNQYMHDSYKPQSAAPPELPQTLDKLKENGYNLGVVSNRDRPFGEELLKIDLIHYFEFSLAGGEVNSYKPEAGIFQAALKRIDARPEETIYVGDNYFADVVGSRRAGLVPVLYDPRGLFPDAGCATIANFGQLLPLLKRL